MKKITDKSFVYTPSFDTDLRAKFKKIIASQQKLTKLKEKFNNVQPIVPVRNKAQSK